MAPGPDEFTFKLFQTIWPELKGEMMSLFHQFYEIAEFKHWFSFSFVAFICNISYLYSLSNFMPISLLGWDQMLVLRVLVARLKRVIGKLVHDSQSAFLWRRSIF